MQVRVNQSANAVYVNLTDAAIVESEQVANGIVIDYDAESGIVGVEILDSSPRVDDLKTQGGRLQSVE